MVSGHLSFLTLLVFVLCFYGIPYKRHSKHHREERGTVKYWICMPAIHYFDYLSDDNVKSACSIYQQLILAHNSALSAEEACSCKHNMATCPSPAAKVSKKPIRVNPLVFTLQPLW